MKCIKCRENKGGNDRSILLLLLKLHVKVSLKCRILPIIQHRIIWIFGYINLENCEQIDFGMRLRSEVFLPKTCHLQNVKADEYFKTIYNIKVDIAKER